MKKLIESYCISLGRTLGTKKLVQENGIMPIPPHAQGMPPAWISYVTVDDVDASAKLAEKLGGKIMVGPRDIPDVGRFAVLKDPLGASIAIITYAKKK